MYFYSEVGDDPDRYDYDERLLETARQWSFERFRQALDAGRSPVVVDRGNGLNPETRRFARCAVERGYRVELSEPDSPWWADLRVLLKYQPHTERILDMWADRLAEKSRANHSVPARTIRDWMRHWKWDLTVEEILAFEPDEADEPEPEAPADAEPPRHAPAEQQG